RQHALDLFAQGAVVAAGLVEVSGARLRVAQLPRSDKDGLREGLRIVHGSGVNDMIPSLHTLFAARTRQNFNPLSSFQQCPGFATDSSHGRASGIPAASTIAARSFPLAPSGVRRGAGTPQ